MTLSTRPVKQTISKAEVARRRGVSRPTVYAMLRSGLLPADEQGRIPRAEFLRLEALLRASNPEPQTGEDHDG